MTLEVDPAFYKTPYQNYPGWGIASLDRGVTWNAGALDVAFQLSDGPVVVGPTPTPAPVTYKLDARTNGKGTVTISPAAKSYAPGTVVTLTAVPAAGQPWVGWTGAVASKSPTLSLTITKDTAVTANFG